MNNEKKVITVAEVAEKLGMAKTERGDYIGTSPEDRAADFLVYSTNDYRPIGSASSTYLGGCHYYTAKQVAELAGIEYELYEGYVAPIEGGLLERATEAAMELQRKQEQQEMEQQQSEAERARRIAIHAMQSVLGVEPDDTQIRKNGIVVYEGWTFKTDYFDDGSLLQLQKACDRCGAAMWFDVPNIAQLGVLVQEPTPLCALCQAEEQEQARRDEYAEFSIPTLDELRQDAYMALDEIAENDELRAELTIALYAAEVQHALLDASQLNTTADAFALYNAAVEQEKSERSGLAWEEL